MLESRQRRVECALLDEQRAAGDLFDAEQDAVAVLGRQGDGLQDQQIECAWQQGRFFSQSLS